MKKQLKQAKQRKRNSKTNCSFLPISHLEFQTMINKDIIENYNPGDLINSCIKFKKP